MSLLGRGARGLVAGTFGTAAFDIWLFARYRQGGGNSGFVDWETSAGVTSWDDAPAPALLGKRLFEGVTGSKLAPALPVPGVCTRNHHSAPAAVAAASSTSAA